MRLGDGVRNNVVFLGVLERGIFRAKAIAFFAAIATKYGSFLYLVTAEHVITKIFERGHKKVFVRMNADSKNADCLEIPIEQWFFHPCTERHVADVAVAQISIDLSQSNFLATASQYFVMPHGFAEGEFDVGDEIAIIGLFRNHHGKGKNIPIVRIGNLAAVTKDPIRTLWGELEAYLVELRSLGGLGGSPVYVQHSIDTGNTHDSHKQEDSGVYLLGVMSGAFNLPNLIEDAIVEESIHGVDDQNSDTINSGIGVVIPAYRILETINRAEFAQGRANAMLLAEQSGGNFESGISQYLRPVTNPELLDELADQLANDTNSGERPRISIDLMSTNLLPF